MKHEYRTTSTALSVAGLSLTLALGMASAASSAPSATQAGTAAASASTAAQDSASRKAIAEQANAFVTAFDRGDAKALGVFWTTDADYIGPDGRVLRGRDAIVVDYAELFEANKGLKARIEMHSIRFPTPETAIEDGVTTVIGPEGSLPSRTRYTNTLVKRDGQWMLSSVRESDYVPAGNAEHLRTLDWTIGDWLEERSDRGPRAHAIFDWTPDLHYIVVARGVVVGDALLFAGSERIGWDPITQRVRSWSFEADGGFGEGAWTSADGTWIIRSNAVLASGSRMVSTTTVKRVDPVTITWQVTGQSIDGIKVPDSPVVTMKRVHSADAR